MKKLFLLLALLLLNSCLVTVQPRISYPIYKNYGYNLNYHLKHHHNYNYYNNRHHDNYQQKQYKRHKHLKKYKY